MIVYAQHLNQGLSSNYMNNRYDSNDFDLNLIKIRTKYAKEMISQEPVMAIGVIVWKILFIFSLFVDFCNWEEIAAMEFRQNYSTIYILYMAENYLQLSLSCSA